MAKEGKKNSFDNKESEVENASFTNAREPEAKHENSKNNKENYLEEELKKELSKAATGQAEPKTERSKEQEIEENITSKFIGLQEDLEQSKDKYFRLAAEFENYKKRQAQQAILKDRYANEIIAKDLFTVIDSLEIALKHIDEDKNSENFEDFVKGIHLVHQQLIDVLKQHHIQKMNVLGENFDPIKHEAVAMIETDKVEENKIFSVFKAGYFLHDKVIRPAVVQVAKKKQG
jgi:molecular chaperone GrpE